jgi:hypothetical protein
VVVITLKLSGHEVPKHGSIIDCREALHNVEAVQRVAIFVELKAFKRVNKGRLEI